MFSIYNGRYFEKVTLSIPGYAEITDRMVQLIEKRSYHTVLDVVAGGGRIALKLTDSVFKVVTLDSSKEMLEKMREKIKRNNINNIQIVKKDIASWELFWPNTGPILVDCAFTSIICNFALHSINDKWKKIVLKKLRESTKPGGQIIITDVKPEGAWRVRKEADDIYRKLILEKENRHSMVPMIRTALTYLFFGHPLSTDAWEELLKEAGYKNTQYETFGDFILVRANN